MTESTPAARREGALLDALSTRPVVFDGAIGTALYERKMLYTQNFDQQCLVKPDLVRAIHASHLAAGAEVLQSNSFGANRYRLAAHNLDSQMEAINRAAVRLAREVAGDRAWVA